MMATMSDAHREWHLNSGVPMGLPGCPQDACHADDMDPSEVRRLVRQREINFALMRGEEGDATIECAHCNGIHLSVRAVKDCAVAHGIHTVAPKAPAVDMEGALRQAIRNVGGDPSWMDRTPPRPWQGEERDWEAAEERAERLAETRIRDREEREP